MSRVAFLLLFLPLAGNAQPYLNLGFEAGSGFHAVSWYWNCPDYDIREDPSLAYAGAQSLRVRNLTSPPRFPCTIHQKFPVDAASGKHIRFSGYIKTEGVTTKPAGLYWIVYGDSGRSLLSNDSNYSAAPQGTRDWTPFVIDRDVSPAAADIDFGVIVSGNGTVYFDGLTIAVDGVPYPQRPDALGRPPTAEERDWILRNSILFETANAPLTHIVSGEQPDLAGGGAVSAARDFSDLAPVKQMIGNARVIGIGESTHGTHEFFKMKHRMLEFLVSEVGVSIFAIEANMPEAYRINDYVLTGKGDPVALVKGMGFWTWNTREVLDMVLWMRAYNAAGRGKIQFTGFDLQSAPLAMDNVRAFVTNTDPAYLSQLNAIYAQVTVAQNINGTYGPTQLAAVQSAVTAADQVVQHLDGNRAAYAKKYSAADIEWAVQNARVVEQATYGRTGDPGFRDSAMATNAQWILRQAPPDTRMMMWAHDGHIQRTAGNMGSYLDAAYGRGYLPIAQLFHQGQYNARVDNGQSLVPPVMLNDADASEPGSLEYALHATGAPRLILDLRKASTAEPASAWLLGGLQLRSIGAFAPTQYSSFSVRFTLTQDFDAVIFFDQARASDLLPF